MIYKPLVFRQKDSFIYNKNIKTRFTKAIGTEGFNICSASSFNKDNKRGFGIFQHLIREWVPFNTLKCVFQLCMRQKT